ncbi:MAG: helix-turn-helix transcriptional regulator [Methylocella sp.]
MATEPPKGSQARRDVIDHISWRVLLVLAVLGQSHHIAARELKISRATARNQLKSVFAKTDTHRQSELVALLLQVG